MGTYTFITNGRDSDIVSITCNTVTSPNLVFENDGGTQNIRIRVKKGVVVDSVRLGDFTGSAYNLNRVTTDTDPNTDLYSSGSQTFGGQSRTFAVTLSGQSTVEEPTITTETETRTETIPYTTIEQDNPEMLIGDTAVVQVGVNGEREVTEEITYTDGVETNRVEISSIIITPATDEIIDVGTQQPPVMGTINIQGADATATAINSLGERITLSLNAGTRLPQGDYTLELVADSGLYINQLRHDNRYGAMVEVTIPDNSVMVEYDFTLGASKFFDFTTDLYDEDTGEPEPEPDVSGFNHLYKMTTESMNSLATERFVVSSGNPGETYDLASNVINILELPFALSSEFERIEKRIVLGITTLNTMGMELKGDRYEIDFGEIAVPLKFNNSYDFLNTEVKIHLPFVDVETVPIDYVIGETIGITYSVDLYTGDTDVNITSSKMTGEVFSSQQIKIGRNIPFIRRDGSTIVSPANNNGLNNGVFSPFVEVIRNIPYNADSYFNTPIIIDTVLSVMTGYVKVEDIKLQTTATLEEQELIKTLLRNGVVINE